MCKLKETMVLMFLERGLIEKKFWPLWGAVSSNALKCKQEHERTDPTKI